MVLYGYYKGDFRALPPPTFLRMEPGPYIWENIVKPV